MHDTFLPTDDDAFVSWIVKVMVLMIQTVCLVIVVAGTFGNIMIMLLMGRQRSASAMNVFFVALAASDLTLVWFGAFDLWMEYTTGFPLHNMHNVTCKLSAVIIYVSGIVSVWLLAVMTLQRAASVLWPHRVNIMFTLKKAKLYTVGIVSIVFLLNSHLLYGAVLDPPYNGSDYFCSYPKLAPEYNFFRDFIWTWIDALLFSLLPFAILISSNSVLIWKVSDSVRKARATLASGQSDQLSSRTKKASSLTVTLIVVSVVFFLLTGPMSFYLIIVPFVIDVGKESEKESMIIEFTYWLLTLMWYSNSAVNFYLYCLTGTKFRADTRKMLTCFKQQKPISELPSPSVNAQLSPINTETFNTETFNTETFNTETVENQIEDGNDF